MMVLTFHETLSPRLVLKSLYEVICQYVTLTSTYTYYLLVVNYISVCAVLRIYFKNTFFNLFFNIRGLHLEAAMLEMTSHRSSRPTLRFSHQMALLVQLTTFCSIKSCKYEYYEIDSYLFYTRTLDACINRHKTSYLFQNKKRLPFKYALKIVCKASLLPINKNKNRSSLYFNET